MLDSAAEVVVLRGYDGLRYQDVSLATGVPVASLRHYFPTIDGLRNEALTQSIHDELAMLRGVTEAIEDPWDQLCVFVQHALGVDSHARRYSWLMWIEYWRSAARDPDLVWMNDAANVAWTHLVRSMIERGVRSGRFSLDQSIDDATYEVSVIIDGVGPGLAMDPDNAEVATRAHRRVLRSCCRLLGVPEADCPDV